MSDVLVKPAFQSTYPDTGETTKFGPNAWNAARLFSQGNVGDLPVRNTGSATGAAWQSKPSVDVRDYGALGNGTNDDRAAIQAAIDAITTGTVLLPVGTYRITPVANKTTCLTLKAGITIRMEPGAVLKVANGSAPYDAVFTGTGCDGCQIVGGVIDANVANNALVNLAEIQAHGRIEVKLAGNDIVVRDLTIRNTTAINTINITGNRATVSGCRFTGVGDDPNHVIHDTSVIYLHGSQLIVSSNHFTAASRGAPAGYTAIETHGSAQTIAGNTVVDFVNGINFTGVYEADSEAGAIVNNTISGCQFGMVLWSSTYTTHTTGYGIDGLVVTGNSIRCNQLSYTAPIWGNYKITGGIFFSPDMNLPVRNVLIGQNTVVFDFETVSRSGDSGSIGIGGSGATCAFVNVSVLSNQIDNAPIAAIKFGGTSIDGLEISHNIIRNAATSLDGAIDVGYKRPIFLSFTGIIRGRIASNTIIDDLATSRITYPFYFAAGVASDLSVEWNTVSLVDATASSWAGWFFLQDNLAQPFVRMIATAKPWVPPVARTMASGSQVYDATTNTQHYLWATGTGWTKSIKVSSLFTSGIRTLTGNGPSTADDFLILCDSTSNDIVVSLLNPGVVGLMVVVKKIAAAHSVFVGGQSIDGGTVTLTVLNSVMRAVWDGTMYRVI